MYCYCIFMFTNKKRDFFQRLEWLNTKISCTVHAVNGMYNSTHQSTNSDLEMANFNHIQADCSRLLPYKFHLQKNITLMIHI